MLKKDLATAKLEYENEDGVADFHILRHVFGTMLARAGTAPQIAKKLTRHSDINLTLKYYTHLTHSDQSKALEQLPTFAITEQVLAKTGTCDTPENLTANLTVNPTTIHHDLLKSSREVVDDKNNREALNPFETNGLLNKKPMRVPGLEPRTYGLKSRCSTN